MATITKPATVRLSRAHRALTVLPLTTFVVDSAIIGLSIGAAAALRQTNAFLDPMAPVSNLSLVALTISLGWLVLIAARGGYDTEVFGAGVEEYKRILTASAVAAGLIGIGCYLAQFPLSRGFFLFSFLVGVPAILLGRIVLRKALQRARRGGFLRRHVVIVGATASADEIASVLQRETWLGYEVLGAVTPMTEVDSETPSGIPVLGNIEDIYAVAHEVGADLVFFAGGGITSARQMRDIMWELEHAAIHVVVAPSMTDVASERVKIRPVGGLPLIHIGKPRSAQALSWAKRGFDVIGSSVLLLLTTPLMCVAAVSIAAHDRGPVLFRQERTGRGGHQFSCFKFRTMVVDAEDRLQALHEQVAHTEGLFKMKDDPRITRPGRWLRRYSVDEVPQLWNVFRGDMSLVGPRPPLPSEVATYDVASSRRLSVRPGMTGLWQVSGRSNLSWDETIRLDIYYVDNWSMLQDLSILMKTLRAVLRSDGAY